MRAFIGTFLIIASLLLTAVAHASVTAQRSGGDGLLDLPATSLTPGDAAAVGIEGTGRFENGHFRSLTEYSAIRAEFLNIPLAEVESTLTDAGYLQGYTSNLGIPQQPGNPDSPPTRVVFSSIYEYATDEGAAAAWAINSDYSGVTIAVVDSSLIPSGPIGDQAVMTRTTSGTMEEEGPSDQIDTLFRIGNIIAATGIIDYGMTVEDVENPGPSDPLIVAQVEQLAARLIERVEEARGGTVPGLSTRALVLSADQADPGFSSEGYRLIGAELIPYYNGYEDDLGQFLSPEMESVYEVGQGLGSPGSDPFDPYFASRHFSFADDSSAADYLAQVPSLLPPGFEIVEPSGSPSGEGSLLVEYEIEVGPGFVALGYQVWQRTKNVVAMFFLESADHRPSEEAIATLADAQIVCLSSGCETILLPAGW